MNLHQDAEILRRLRSAGDSFIPGSDLAGDPAQAAARLAALSDAGYQIERHPHLGYRLVAGPDHLIADDILSRIPRASWLRDVLVFESTASTNDLINQLGRKGAPAGVAAFAEEQTAGRGRLGRRWDSQPRLGLWFSLLLRPDELPPAHWTRLTFWLAYGIAQGIESHAAHMGLPFPGIMLKWPNDLHIAGRKVAGLLVESSHGRTAFATAGAGINVNHTTFPPPLDSTATSLCLACGSPLDRNALAASILHSLDSSFSLVLNHFDQILAWASEADTLRGQWVSATTGHAVFEGLAQGLDPRGALLIATPSGVVPIHSGEVTRFSSHPA